MKSRILISIGAMVAASAAMAADLPRKTAPIAPVSRAVPMFVWTGFYAGVNAGYGFGSFTGSAGPLYKDPNGFTGGGQIGYNHQIGNVVVGLETDLAYAHLRGGPSAVGIGGKNTVDYIGTVRGRVGYAVDRFMPYLTAGYAYGGSTVTATAFGKSTPMHHGWTVGGGVEYAFTNNITAKIEGLYVDLADQRVLANTRKSGAEVGIIRAGVNYKF